MFQVCLEADVKVSLTYYTVPETEKNIKKKKQLDTKK